MIARPIFLLGMMGAGKSRVGRVLAAELGASFIDLDARIERMFAASIPALFELGEDYFRACERVALRSLLAEPGFEAAEAVVATGGGVVVEDANLEAMDAAGDTVYLELGAEELGSRLAAGSERAHRPLLADGSAGLTERLSELLAARAPAYARAKLRVDASGEPEQVAAHILAAIGR